MSNTVRLYALTGETATGQSLSTADDVARRLAERTRRAHGFPVPVIWHDVDYPLAMMFTGTSGQIDWPVLRDIEQFSSVVVTLGGSCWQDLRWGFPELWRQDQPVHWRLPGTFDPEFIARWAGRRNGSRGPGGPGAVSVRSRHD